jgi:hypothetical protein
MIILKRSLIEGLDSVQGLRDALGNAIRLEHATIPTYLYALYSLKDGSNAQIRSLIRSIVMEEMLHVTLACNVLNAIGGAPAIDDPTLIPIYPGPLPGGVEDTLIVPLKRFSIDVVTNVFMAIEAPENPIVFPVEALAAMPKPVTIGMFYGKISEQIMAQGQSIFTGDPNRQVTKGFPADELIKVTDVPSALKAIEIIVEQGEGTTKSPLDLEHGLAHFYRYQEISRGQTLAPDSSPQGFHWGDPPIPFDPTGVWPVIDNPKAASYPAGSMARLACDTFNYTYTSLLKTLHIVFNGHPGKLNSAIGLMESLKEQAGILMETELPDGTHAGPSFQWQPVNP